MAAVLEQNIYERMFRTQIEHIVLTISQYLFFKLPSDPGCQDHHFAFNHLLSSISQDTLHALKSKRIITTSIDALLYDAAVPVVTGTGTSDKISALGVVAWLESAGEFLHDHIPLKATMLARGSNHNNTAHHCFAIPTELHKDNPSHLFLDLTLSSIGTDEIVRKKAESTLSDFKCAGFALNAYATKAELLNLQKDLPHRFSNVCNLFANEFKYQFNRYIKHVCKKKIPESINVTIAGADIPFTLDIRLVIENLLNACYNLNFQSSVVYIGNLLDVLYKFTNSNKIGKSEAYRVLENFFLLRNDYFTMLDRNPSNEKQREKIPGFLKRAIDFYELRRQDPTEISLYTRKQLLRFMGVLIAKLENVANKEEVQKAKNMVEDIFKGKEVIMYLAKEANEPPSSTSHATAQTVELNFASDNSQGDSKDNNDRVQISNIPAGHSADRLLDKPLPSFNSGDRKWVLDDVSAPPSNANPVADRSHSNANLAAGHSGSNAGSASPLSNNAASSSPFLSFSASAGAIASDNSSVSPANNLGNVSVNVNKDKTEFNPLHYLVDALINGGSRRN